MIGWAQGAGIAAAVGGVGLLATAAVMAHYITRPRRLSHAPGSTLGERIEDVHFRTDDGVTLHGWYFGQETPRAAIALTHGFAMTRAEMVDLAHGLHARGYALLLFDLRAHGASEGRRTSIGHHEARDVIAAARYLHERPELAGCRIGALGFSMGGVATLVAAAHEPLIEAVVSDSAFASLDSIVAGGLRVLYRLPPFPFAPLIVRFGELLVGAKIGENSAIRHVPRIAPRPLLIIHGDADRLIPVGDGRALHAAAGLPKDLWIVPEVGHVRAFSTHPEAYLDRVDRFFAAALAPAAIKATGAAQIRQEAHAVPVG